MSRYMNLTVVEVQGPDRILARETPGPTASAETMEYITLFKEMNAYFNNDVLTFEIHSPKPNEICAALNSQNNKWYRVRVGEILMTLSGAKADCWFLDTGEKQMIQIVKIQKIPERFLRLPFQIKVFALYGLQPLSLVIDPTMRVSNRPCKKWDKSAATYIKKMINHASVIQAVIKSRGEESVLLAMIYLRFFDNDEIVSINDELINKGYAIKDPQLQKKSDKETDTFLQDDLLTEYVNQEEVGYPINNYNCSSVSQNDFHRKLVGNKHPVCVEAINKSDVSHVVISSDDSSYMSSSSSSNTNNFSLFPLEQTTCMESKNYQNIQCKNSSSGTSFETSANQQTTPHLTSLNQLLSYHKKFQQNNKIEKNSSSLKSHSVCYQMPDLEENTSRTEPKSCHLDLPVTSFESESSQWTENSEMLFVSKNISPVISNEKKVTCQNSPSAQNQQILPDTVSKLKTGSALRDFLSYHNRLSSRNPDSKLVAFSTQDHSSKMCAKTVPVKSAADGTNSQAKNCLPVGNFKAENKQKNESVNNDKRNSKLRLSQCKQPQPVVNRSSCDQQPSPVTNVVLNNDAHYYGTKSDVPFGAIQTKADCRPSSMSDFHCTRVENSPKVTAPVCTSAKRKDNQRKPSSYSSEHFSSTDSDSANEHFFITKGFHRKDKEITKNLDTYTRSDNLSNPSRNYCRSQKNISSESPNSKSHQSNASSQETALARAGFSNSAVNILNRSVSSKLLSFSPGNTVLMLQGLNKALPLDKLNNSESDNSSEIGFSNECQAFNDNKDSDLTENGKPCLGFTSRSPSGKNSVGNFKNEFKKSENQERKAVVTDNVKTLPLIPVQESSDSKYFRGMCDVLPVPHFSHEETLGSCFKSQVKRLQPSAAPKRINARFDDTSQQGDLLSLPKIENLAEFTTATLDLKPDHPTIDIIETNKSDTDAFFHESKEKENYNSSFELLTTDENHGISSQRNSTNTDLHYKDHIVASSSADCHNHASDLEIDQENKRKEILPLIASDNPKKNPSVEIIDEDSNSQILAAKSSSSDEKIGVLSSDEPEKNKHLEVLKYIEPTIGNKSFSSIDIARGSDLKTRSSSSGPSSVADSEEAAPSTLADLKSNNVIDPALLNIEAPCLVAPIKTNNHTEMERLNDNLESISLPTIPAVPVPMPALIDDSTDYNSEGASSVKDFEIDSTSLLMSDSSDDSKFVSQCVSLKEDSSSTSQPSITGITEPEALSVRVASDGRGHLVSLSPQTKTNDDHKLSSSSSLNDEDFESVTSGDDVAPDNSPGSVLSTPPSIPDTCNKPENLLSSGSDIGKLVAPELDNPALPSETVDNKLDNSVSLEQYSFAQCKTNDLCSDKAHIVSDRTTDFVSTSTSDNVQTTSASNMQPVSPPEDTKLQTIPVSSPSSQDSSDQVIRAKKDLTSPREKSLNVRDHAVECIRGRSILEKLGVTKNIKKTEGNYKQSISTESILLNDSVLFVAEKIPNPIYNLQDFKVPEVLAKLIENLSIQPKPIQAYSWGPAIRGKNVIGISPSGSGKTWAYIVPVVASLCQYTIYSDIKFSNGPFVLILVPSWRKAISIYEQCKCISQSNREIIVELVYGGGEENKKSVILLNGCHILVATLPCFLRMWESKFTNLDRLCHLIIDDADILLQDFYKEIVDLMCKYRSLVESRDKNYQRHQVMAYSSKWTSYIKGFLKNAIHDPVIIITDMMEAAVYGCVKQIPIMCEESSRKDQLVNLVPQIIKQGEKVIIFTQNNECYELQSLLSELLQNPVAVACDTIYKFERENISTDWKLPLSEKESYRVLVCSDMALSDLSINDATCVVHYQMPKRKIHIGLRIQTMSNYYQHYNSDKAPVKSVKSYILITTEDKKQVKSMRSFLMRSTDVTDKVTWDFLSNIRQVEDLDPKKKLCLNIKAFGKCRYKHQCNDRHCVVPSVDLNGASLQHIYLPFQGDVRVKILHVKTANNFYVRILEHQIGTSKSIQIHSDLGSLIMGMAVYYSNHSNRKTLDELTTGMLCIVNTNEQFSRVKVLQPYNNGSKNTAQLFFVDIGKVESHPICNLYQLADDFKAIPFQAVEVFLCRLHPVDFDIEWTPAANSFAESWLESKMLYGKIRFVMDNTLWLDPLLERTFMKAIKTVTNGPSLRRELINNNLAIDNPQHLIQLHKLFDGYVPKLIPSNTLPSSCSTWEFNLEHETLQAGDDYENVTISYIFNPEHFYVQKLDMKICLNDLMMKIQEKMALQTEPQAKREWLTGMHCLSKSSMDSRWYRVIILSLLESQAVVHFVDYGNVEEVCIDELQTMPRELTYLPSQAIECKLAHIKPSDEQWSAQCNNIMYYMSQTADNIYKTLAINVISEIHTEEKLPQYCVNLLDTSYERVINIGQELIWWKMAVPNDNHFQLLFPQPVTEQIFYPTADKIAEMCAILYHDEVSSQEYLLLMHSYLIDCLNYPEKLIEENVPGNILKCLSYTQDPDKFSLIVDSVKVLVSAPSLLDNLMSCGILQNLGQILKMNDDVSILHATIQLIQFMTESNTSLLKPIASLKSGLFSILCEIVKSVYQNEIRTSVCQLLESFCLADEKCTENLIQLQVCPICLPNVLEVQDHDFTEAYLSLLAPISLLDSGLVAIKREKPIGEIMKIVEAAICEKCLYKCLVALKRLADKSRKNKTLLLELNAIAIFSSCQNLVKDTKVSTLCQELLDGLLVKVNHNQGNKITVSTLQQPTNENHFQVFWCQNKFRLLLTVKLNNSEWSDCKFHKTSVHFSFIPHDGVKQTVDYELFDEVVAEKCAICIQNNETILSFCKAEFEYWPRLLQDKYKPTNLCVDFDKIVDSDDSGSEEVEADEENLFTLQVVVKKPLIKLKKISSCDEEEEAEKEDPLPVDSAKSDEDSLENSDFEEYDRFNIFNTKYA